MIYANTIIWDLVMNLVMSLIRAWLVSSPNDTHLHNGNPTVDYCTNSNQPFDCGKRWAGGVSTTDYIGGCWWVVVVSNVGWMVDGSTLYYNPTHPLVVQSPNACMVVSDLHLIIQPSFITMITFTTVTVLHHVQQHPSYFKAKQWALLCTKSP